MMAGHFPGTVSNKYRPPQFSAPNRYPSRVTTVIMLEKKNNERNVDQRRLYGMHNFNRYLFNEYTLRYLRYSIGLRPFCFAFFLFS